MIIEKGNTLRIGVTPVYEKLYEVIKGLNKLSTIVEVGGAGSSKSHSIAQLLIQLINAHKGLRIGIGRKTFPSHRTSGMSLFIDLLKKYKIYNNNDHNKTNHEYNYNGNYVLFFSLGEGESGREKIKSADFNIIWPEEATEFDLDDYRQMKLRLRHPRSKGLHNFIILSHNPIDENHWIKTELIDKDPEIIVLHSTYLDNSYCDEEYAHILNNLINEDMNYYRIYTLGQWGMLENIIYTDWKIVDEFPQGAKWVYGLDFGYNHPTALTKCGVYKGKAYFEERIYQTNLTNSDLIEKLSHELRGDIFADSAEPDRIEEIKRAGYNIYPVDKSHKDNTVRAGIDLCKSHTLNITLDSVNIIKEIKGYSWKVDKNGKRLDEPVKFRDDGCDSFRYGFVSLVKRYGWATADPDDRDMVKVFDVREYLKRKSGIPIHSILSRDDIDNSVKIGVIGRNS